MTFINQWNDYLWSKMVLINETIQTIPVLLVSITKSWGQQIGYGVPFAGYVLSAIPLILLFAVGSKQYIEGLTSGAFKM
jgi:ABC-type glycerol-3-phosphate transport system permease component